MNHSHSPLDEKFWKRFAKTNWERKSIVVKNLNSEISQLGSKEVFDLLVAAADQSRRTKTLLGFKFFVNGIRSSDVETMFVLPRKSDRTLLGYHERMERVYQDYCLVCDELMQVNQQKQHLLNQFTRKLYEQIGFPNRFAEMGLYLGNYRKTPFGVHIDKCGVFSFPVIGTKKFRVWSSAYVEKHPQLEQSFSYSKHKSKSQLLVVAPGEMSYWPSSAWHIAESNGKFTATWSLGVWVDKPTHETISELLTELLCESLGDNAKATTVKVRHFHTASGEVDELPNILKQAVTTITTLTPTKLENALLKTWIKQLSNHGMKTLPRPHSTAKLGQSVALRNLDSPILWSSLNKKEIPFIYGFATAEPQLSKSKQLLRIIKDLNGGKTCLVKTYLKRASRSADTAALRRLAEAGAFRDLHVTNR